MENDGTTPVLFGEVLFDCFEDDSRVLGGAPFNVAWHLQAFGCNPTLISRVGNDDMGKEILVRMQQWGMSTSGIQLDNDHPTGEVKIELENGEPTFDIISQRAWDYIDEQTLPDLTPSLIYHGSLGLRDDVSRTAFARLLERNPSAPLFLDVNLRPPWWNQHEVETLLAKATWLKINDQELVALEKGGRTLREKAKRIIKRNAIKQIIVTQGEQGAFSLQADDTYHEVKPSGSVQVVDTVGAGDAFAAVSILGMINHWDTPKTLQRAQQFASKIVSQRGAISDKLALYRSFEKQWDR